MTTDANSGCPAEPLALIKTLQQARDPLYALLDAARDDAVLVLLREAGTAPVPLLRDTKAAELEDYGAQLVALRDRPGLIERLVHRGWGRSWGIYLTSRTPEPELAAHLRGNCWTDSPDGRRLYFRWYDPRVLRTALPAMSADGRDAFLGPVTGLLLEAADPAEMDCWTRSRAEIAHSHMRVVIPDRPSRTWYEAPRPSPGDMTA